VSDPLAPLGRPSRGGGDRRAPWRVNGPYRRLCCAVSVSELGDWLLFIALPLYVLGTSGSALDTSTVFLAELIPAVVVGTVCGPLIDRWSPSRMLAVLTGLQTFVVLPLLLVGPGRVWIVFVVAAVQAAFTSLTTPAQQAVVPLLVKADQTSGANAMVQTASNTARLIGAPLGGVLLPAIGLRGMVVADAATFLVSAALLTPRGFATRNFRSTHPPSRGGRLAAITEGWNAARASGTLLAALAISFLAAIAQGLFLLLFVLFVLRSLHAGDQLVGVLRGVQAIGGVLGGVVIGTWARHARARIQAVWGLTAFALISALCWNSPAWTTAPWWYVALFIAVGIPATALSTGLITGTQDASPPRLRGRVLSLMSVAQALGQATGILTAGLLSAVTPLTVLLNAQAGCYLACALIAIIGFDCHRSKRDARPRQRRLSRRTPHHATQD
jgi:MFS family permease